MPLGLERSNEEQGRAGFRQQQRGAPAARGFNQVCGVELGLAQLGAAA